MNHLLNAANNEQKHSNKLRLKLSELLIPEKKAKKILIERVQKQNKSQARESYSSMNNVNE